jgi:hypothetical protein
MTTSRAKIVITSDGKQAIQEANKVGSAVKKIGGHHKTVAEQADRYAHRLVGVASIAATALATIRKMAQAQDDVRKAAAETGKAMNQQAMSLDVSLARMGVRGEQADRLRAMASESPEAGATVTKLMGQLSGRRLRPGTDLVSLAEAARSGVFADDEITDAARRGRRLDIAGRSAELGPAAQVALNTQEVTRRDRAAEVEALRNKMQREQIIAQALATQRKESPIWSMVQDILTYPDRLLGIDERGDNIMYQRRNRGEIDAENRQYEELRRIRQQSDRPRADGQERAP